MFSHDYTEVMHFWQKCHRNDVGFFLVHHIMGFIDVACLITGDADLDLLAKVLSAL